MTLKLYLRRMPPPEAQATMLARFNATRAIKKQWQSQGRKLSQFSGSDIREAANAYLLAHPEVVKEAKATVDGWIARANLKSDAQSPDH
jgi:hypothetical protein